MCDSLFVVATLEALAYAAVVGDDKDLVKQVPMPIGEIVIYPIKGEELEQLEQGGPSSTLLALMLALLGVGVGGLISIMLTGPAPKDPSFRYMLAIVIVAVTLLVGAVLAVVWWRMPNPVKKIIEKVKAREMPPPAPASQAQPPALPPPSPGLGVTNQVILVEVENKL